MYIPGHNIYFYGGESGRQYFDGLYLLRYDFPRFRWESIYEGNAVWIARVKSTMVCINGSLLLIFGGGGVGIIEVSLGFLWCVFFWWSDLYQNIYKRREVGL